MAAGKLALLLVAGGLAGAAFAGMTTSAMRPYRDREARLDTRPSRLPATDEAAPGNSLAARSWLDEGVRLLDAPAWPFGPGSDEEAAAPVEERGYYDDDRRDRYDDEPGGEDHPWQREERHYRGYRSFEGYAREPEMPAESEFDEAIPRRPPERSLPASRPGDAAADAARRAADAAQDVEAAEGAH